MEQCCRKCKRVLPLNEVYFFKQPANKSGFKYQCKECLGSNFVSVIKNNDGVQDGFIKCSKCKMIKPATKEYFHKGKDNKYNLKSSCKTCRAIAKKEYTEKNRDKINQKNREYHKIHRERERQYSRNYYRDHKDIIKLKRPVWWNNWYSKNKEELLEKRKEWYKNNRELEIAKVRQYQKTEKGRINVNIQVQKRKARLKGLPYEYSREDWIRTISYFDNRCCYCGEEKKLTKDHFIPLSKGGEFTVNNVIPACLSCNTSKYNNDFYKWFRKQPFYTREKETKILKFLGYKGNNQQLAMF